MALSGFSFDATVVRFPGMCACADLSWALQATVLDLWRRTDIDLPLHRASSLQ